MCVAVLSGRGRRGGGVGGGRERGYLFVAADGAVAFGAIFIALAYGMDFDNAID